MSWRKILLALITLIILGALVYQIPAVNNRLGWRIVAAEAYVRGLVNPAGELPPPAQAVTPLEQATELPTLIPTDVRGLVNPAGELPPPAQAVTPLEQATELPTLQQL